MMKKKFNCLPNLEIGDYVSFWNNEDVLYKVLDKYKEYILIKDVNNETYWEHIEYVVLVVQGFYER